METVQFVRTIVLRQTQKQFASMLGVSQGTVSRWELPAGHRLRLQPDLSHLKRIRKAAMARGEYWRDEWFFTQPDKTVLSLVEAKRDVRKKNRRA